MAAESQKQNKYAFQLPLKVSSDKPTELKPEHLESVFQALSEDLPLLNKCFQKAKLPFVKIKKVDYTKGDDITFTCEVESEEELDNFYLASKAKLTCKVLTEYALATGIGIWANLKFADNLVLSLELEKADYHKHMFVMCQNDNDSREEHVSSLKNVKPVGSLTAKETWRDVKETHETNKEHEQKDQHTNLMLQYLPTQAKAQGNLASRMRAAKMYRKT